MSETGQKLIEEIRSVAAEFPNESRFGSGECIYLTYPGYRVSYGANPGDQKVCGSCLVGKALFNLNLIDWEMVQQRTTAHGNRWNSAKFADLIKDGFLPELDDLELQWISDAQDYQDDAHEWQDCVFRADVLAARRIPT